LLGQRVRYDGGHKRYAFLVDVFGRYVEWVPVCPEVEMGLTTPRESMRLVDLGGDLRLVASATETDHTPVMNSFLTKRVPELRSAGLSGYVFKRSSPSCGLERVRVYRDGMPAGTGQGLFARRMTTAFPNLPAEEEERLNDARLRENFVSRVFAYQRWMESRTCRFTRRALMEFHRRHRFQLMAHSQRGMHRLGRLLGRFRDYPDTPALATAYWDAFSEVMKRTPSRRSHTYTLGYMAGLLSGELDGGDRQELTDVIESYRLGRLPLIVPVTLLRHHVRRAGQLDLEDQVYLDPHPDGLMLLDQL
jgi:uncharacterized protein YbgA (DUF1722 family)/uncharacterized protein YbbK (DUF523 family)